MRRPVGRRLDLDQVLDEEAVLTQEADPLAVAQVKLHAAGAVPLEAVHAEIWAEQLATGGNLLVGRAQDHYGAVDEEDEPAARPKQAARLRDPVVRVGPDRRAVFRDREVEAVIRKRHFLGAGLEERKLEPELRLHAASRLELR